MRNAWQELRRRNAAEDKVRAESEREAFNAFLVMIPIIPAAFVVTFSSFFRVDFVEEIGYLGTLRDIFGEVLVSYAVVFLYYFFIVIFQGTFYRPLGTVSKIVVAWIAWIWFFYSVVIHYNLGMAFMVLFVASLFMLQFVWYFQWCYQKIRDGMFLDGRNDT